jgi:hypothetical protein
LTFVVVTTPWVETHGYKDYAPNGAKLVLAENIEIVAEKEFVHAG